MDRQHGMGLQDGRTLEGCESFVRTIWTQTRWILTARTCLGGAQPQWLKTAEPFSSQRMPEQGRLVMEQIAHAPGVTEQAEQILRVSMTFDREVTSRGTGMSRNWRINLQLGRPKCHFAFPGINLTIRPHTPTLLHIDKKKRMEIHLFGHVYQDTHPLF